MDKGDEVSTNGTADEQDEQRVQITARQRLLVGQTEQHYP